MTRRHTANAALSNGVKKGLQLKLQSAAFKQVWRRVVSVADATRQAHELSCIARSAAAKRQKTVDSRLRQGAT